MDLKTASQQLQERRDRLEELVAAGEIQLPEAAPGGRLAKYSPEKPREYAPEPAGCPDCRGRGWRVDLETRISTRCECRRRRWARPEDVPAAELLARGVDLKVAGKLKSDWKLPTDAAGKPKPGYEPWPQEADLWPQGMAAPAWSGEAPSWLYIWGPSGSGKSAVAAWIMRRALCAGGSAHWIPIRESIRRTQGRMDSNAPAPVWGQLKRDLVVLDDVGKHRDTEYQVDLVLMWVEIRHTRRGWTVCTSNDSPKRLRQSLPSSVASRILDGARLKLAGPDARHREYRFIDGENREWRFE